MTRRTQLRRLTRRLPRWGRLGLCVSLAVFLSMDPNLVHRQLAIAQTTAEIEAKQEAELAELTAKLEKLFDALEEVQKEIPRETFDPQVIIEGQPEIGFEGVGKDPEKIFEWVRDNTYLVPYRGVLRGDKGVLMDRVGNSLDRALLLMTLLQEAGHENVRLAYGQLSDDKTDELLENARSIPKEGAMPPSESRPEDLADRLDDLAEEFDVNPAELRQTIEQMNLESQRLAEQAVERTFEQSQILIKMLREEELIPDPQDQLDELEQEAKEAFQHHWWVQVKKDKRESSGGLFGGNLFGSSSEFMDLDPSLPDAQPGDVLVKALKTVAMNELNDQLREELHTVEITIKIERWEDGKLVEVPVMKQELFPAAMIGQHITLHHAPIHWPKDLNLFAEEEPLEKLKKVALDQTEWMPVLTRGGEKAAKYAFNDRGEITQPDLPTSVQNVIAGREFASSLEAPAKETGVLIRDVIAGDKSLGGEARNAKSEQSIDPWQPSGRSQLTAEWIDYEIRVPGEKTETIRLQIFDLVGPAARMNAKTDRSSGLRLAELNNRQPLDLGLALLGQTAIMPVIGQMSPEYVTDLHLQHLKKNRESLLSMLRNVGSEAPQALMQRVGEMTTFPGQLYGLVLARSDWSRQRADVYLDRLNILSFHQYFRNNLQEDSIVAGKAFDIVSNGVAISPSTSRQPFLARVEQGVLDTNAEALLFPGSPEMENTAELFRSWQKPWVVIEKENEADCKSGQLTSDVFARICNEVATGQVVVAPISTASVEAEDQFAWWRIDRNTGSCLGIGQRGWGQDATEYKLWIEEAQHLAGLAAILPTAVTSYLGCSGTSPSTAKHRLCVICALLSGLLAYITVANKLGGQGLAKLAYRAGVGSVFLSNICGLISRL